MDPWGNPEPERRRTRPIVILLGILLAAFAIGAGVVVAQSLTDQALAVLAGAVCGVGAAIPTSLLIIAITRRQSQSSTPPPPPPSAPSPNTTQPPVIVVAPGAQPYGVGLPPQTTAAVRSGPPVQRHFSVLGDDDDY